MTIADTYRRLRAFGAPILLGYAVCMGVAPLAFAQVAVIAHFVAPSYPPLARQAAISGQAAMKLTVEKDGSIRNVSDELSTHPLLAQESKACVKEWKFHPATHEHEVTITFFYGFSGDQRESNPRTSVSADFTSSSVLVYIKTNPVSTVHP